MRLAGIVPVDAPDPRDESERRIRALPYPVQALARQPALTELRGGSLMDQHSGSTLVASSAALSYIVWRHPEDHADPRNQVDLDEATRASLAESPPWPRPRWLVESAELLRYPVLWEAIRTTWHADPARAEAHLADQLAAHANYVLRNRFASEIDIASDPSADDGINWRTTVEDVEAASVSVDGDARQGLRIDRNPLIHAVGFVVATGVVCTVVVPRAYLPLIELAVVARDS